MSQDDSTVDDLLNALNTSNDVLKRLALGSKYYNSLNYEDLKDSQEFKNDIITARKHQQHLLQMARNEIEREQLNALLQESAYNLNNDEVSYYKSVKRIKDDTHEKLGEQMKNTRRELQKTLENDSEKLVSEKEKQLSNYRAQFDENEKVRETVENEEINRRKEWKRRVSSDQSDLGRGQNGPHRASSIHSAYRSPSQTNSPRGNITSPSTRKQNSKHSPVTQSPLRKEDFEPSLNSSQNDIVLLMTVDIGDGRVDSIKVYQNTHDYEKLARDFQKKHKLGEQVIKPLTEHIRSNVESLLRDQQRQFEDRLLSDVRSSRSQGKRGLRSNYSQATKAVEHRVGISHSERNLTAPAIIGKLNDNSADAEPLLREKPLIDEKSRILAKKVKNMDKPAHIRLFQRALEQRKKREDVQMTIEEEKLKRESAMKVEMSSQSRILTATRTKGNFQNYGEKLYSEGMILLHERERQSEIQQKINKTKEEMEHTFRPEISEFAKQITRSKDDLLKRITEDPRKSHESRPSISQEEEFPFKPSINEKSMQLMQQKESRRKAIGAAHYELLFRDAERRRMKKEEYSTKIIADATFQPNLNKKSELVASRKDENFDEFIDRLTYSKQQQEEQQRREMQSDIDPITGKKMFVPNYQKPRPKSAWIERNGAQFNDIHNDLYMIRQQVDEERDRLKKQLELESKKMAETSHMRTKSKHISESALEKRLRTLYNTFDKEGSGVINIRTVELQSLDEGIVEMLQSMFKQTLDKGQAHLNADEFVHLAKKFLNKASIHGPKNSILSTLIRSKPPSHAEILASECTFKPNLSKKSEVLAQKKRPSSVKKQRIDYLYHEKSLWESRANDIKEMLEEIRNEDCTFHPNTKSKKIILPNEIEQLTQRLTSHKFPAHNEVLTTDEIRFRENCTFAPNLKKPRMKLVEETKKKDDLNQSYVSIQHRKLNSFLRSEFDQIQNQEFSRENSNPNVLVL